MNRGVLTAAFYLATAVLTSSPIRASPWYERESFACNDPFTLRPAAEAAGWLRHRLPFGLPGGGRVFVALTASDYRAAASNFSQAFDSVLVDYSMRQSLLTIIQNAKADARTQSIAGSLASKLVGFAAGAAAAAGPTLLFLHLSADADSLVVSAQTVEPLIATGGHIDRHLVAASDSGRHEYVYDILSYEVDVGGEKRSIALSACYFPVKIVYSRLKTKGGINDKIFHRNGDLWHTFDVTSARDEGSDWREIDRDDEYIYFNEVDSTGQYRISFRDGKWQTKLGGAWRTLYAAVAAE
jgi:hypothetical protein